MLQKILAFLSILGIILSGLVVYANAAYFPMEKGAAVEEKVISMENQMNNKLDRIVMILEGTRK